MCPLKSSFTVVHCYVTALDTFVTPHLVVTGQTSDGLWRVLSELCQFIFQRHPLQVEDKHAVGICTDWLLPKVFSTYVTDRFVTADCSRTLGSRPT